MNYSTDKSFNDKISLTTKNANLLFVKNEECTHPNYINSYDELFNNTIILNNPEEAIALFNQSPKSFDIIISDLHFDNSGINFLKEIRIIDDDIPVILTTTDSSQDFFIDAIRLKVTDFLIKPYYYRTHLNIIEKVLLPISAERSNKKLLEENYIYQRALDSHNLVTITDIDGLITHANDYYCNISEFSYQELIGETHKLVHNGNIDQSHLLRDLKDTVKSGLIWEGQITNKSKTGRIFHVQSKIFPIKNEANEIIKFLNSSHLINELYETKDKLRDNKKLILQAVSKAKTDKHFFMQKKIQSIEENSNKKIEFLENTLLKARTIIKSQKEDLSSIVKKRNKAENRIIEIEEQIKNVYEERTQAIKRFGKNREIQLIEIEILKKELKEQKDKMNKLTIELSNKNKLIAKYEVELEDNRSLIEQMTNKIPEDVMNQDSHFKNTLNVFNEKYT